MAGVIAAAWREAKPEGTDDLTQKRSAWWRPDIHADRRGFLLTRNRVTAAVREFFNARGFLEVECGALQVSPGNETHLHAFATEMILPDASRAPRYLHTSPEFSCKKLLAAGETRIFDIARVFRNRERTRLHAPEFTMVEWYRVREPYEVAMRDCIDLIRDAALTAGVRELVHREARCDPFAAPEYLTVGQAFKHYAGIDLLSTVRADGGVARDDFARLAETAGVTCAGDDSWSDIFSRVMAEKIEPHLGLGKPCLLYEYPIIEAALARPAARDRRLAERFELYACGVELANGFGELTDPAEQRRRFEADMDLKETLYGERYPVDEDFLAALAQMPPASGVALGLDRLVMLVTAAERIDQVIWTPAQ